MLKGQLHKQKHTKGVYFFVVLKDYSIKFPLYFLLTGTSESTVTNNAQDPYEFIELETTDGK